MSNPPRSAASLSSDSTLGCTRSIIGFGYTPVNTMMPMNTDRTRPSRSVSSLNVEFSSSGSPWNTRWYAQSRYSAARITPAAATTVHQRADANDPMSTRNSPTKPLSPGTPIDESITTVNPAAKIGATDWMPLSALISRVWRRS